MIAKVLKLFFVLLFPLLSVTNGYAQQTEIGGFTMGTYYKIKYIDKKNRLSADVVKQEIDKKLARVNSQMSTYQNDSELSRFNNYDKVNEPFLISDELALVIRTAIEINRLTQGGLDITVGPLVNLWGFGPEAGDEQLPSAIDIEQRIAIVGIDKLSLNGNALSKKIPQLYLDLSAIAKGYGVDVVADYLQSQGIMNYMVDIGGEIRAHGKNQDNQFWRIAIERPGEAFNRHAYDIIQLNNQAVATSGSYRNYFNVDNERYSHTIDPATGYPIKHNIVSLSVVHDSCMYADGLATGFYVLGLDKSLKLANQLNLSIMIIVDNNGQLESHYSDAFKKLLVGHKA